MFKSDTTTAVEQDQDFVIGIRFRNSHKVFNHRINHIPLVVGDDCVVKADIGYRFGTVDRSKMALPESEWDQDFPQVIRKADPDDYKTLNRNIGLEKSAREFCLQKIGERNIPMRLTDVEYTFDARKAIFYFTADGRVDFRQLVKDLNQHLRMKVEMKQIGARDEGRMFGCTGPCGKELCCSSFINEFDPVSIRMAKDQNLSLNPDNITGVCGRLKCCLAFEHEEYKEAQSRAPKVGKYVETPDGVGKVTQVDLLTESVTVQMKDGRKNRCKGCACKKVANPNQKSAEGGTSDKER